MTKRIISGSRSGHKGDTTSAIIIKARAMIMKFLSLLIEELDVSSLSKVQLLNVTLPLKFRKSAFFIKPTSFLLLTCNFLQCLHSTTYRRNEACITNANRIPSPHKWNLLTSFSVHRFT